MGERQNGFWRREDMDFIENFTRVIKAITEFQPCMFNRASETELLELEKK